MSDPRAGRMRTTSGTNRDAQRRILDSTPPDVPGDTHEFGLKPANPGPSSYESAKRGVKSTRTPADWVHDSDPPFRSQTVPLPASSSKKSNVEPRNRRAPTSNPTIPIPTTRQRTRSGPRSHPTNTKEGPKMPEPRNELAGTGYIVEPLAESYSQDYYDDTTLLAPPKMPIPDVRQSTSSFQTEPSSYYTVDENWSTGGPAPQMPEHTATQKNTYEDLWLAAQTPEMPAPNPPGPPMPSPYEKDEDIGDFPHDVHADEHDDEWRPTGSYRMPGQNPRPQPERNPQPQPEHKDTTSSPAPLDRYDSSWLARPSPGMPAPKTASPLMPSPPTSPSEQNKTQPSYTSGPLKTGTSNIPSTAPLRIHHRIRPPSLTQASVATSPFGRVPVSQSRPDGHRVEYNPPAVVGGAPLSKPPTEPTPSTSQHVSGDQRPPAAATTSTQQKPPSSQSFSSEPRPTVSAPVVSPSQKPYVPVYGNLQNIGSTKPPQSISPLGGRVETQPTASTPIAPPTTPHKVTSVHTQHTLPTIPPAPTVSPPSAPTKPKPPAPTPSAPTEDSNTPNLQQHASASASKEKEKEQEKQQQHEHASTATTAAALTRPRRGELSQLDTQYVNMLLALDDIPSLHNIFAGFFNWILLAGFILFPGTFTSLQNLNVTNGQIEQQLLHAVTHLPLFIVAWVCCGFGAVGLIWLWWRWRKNYLWGLNKIFLPGFMNSLAGLISTITNIFGVQHGQLSTTSKSTVVVVTASTAIFAFLTLFYMFWLVRRVKARHDREVGKQRAGKFGEGIVDISTRKI